MVTFGSQQINGHNSRNLSSDSVTVVHFDGANFYAQDDSYIIETNSGNIATNMASIVALTSAEQVNETNIANNTTNIATNTTNIATNTANIATNTANIAINDADITANTNNVATNTINIATNTADISALENEVHEVESSQNVDIDNNRDIYISTATSDITITADWSTLTDGWSIVIVNNGTGEVTFTSDDNDEVTFYPDDNDEFVIRPNETASIYLSFLTETERFHINRYGFSTLASIGTNTTNIATNTSDIAALQFPTIKTISTHNDNIGLSNNGDYVYVSNTAVNDFQIDNFSSAEAGWHCWVINDTGELVRVGTDGTEKINGGDTLFLAPGDSTEIIYDGSNFYSTTRNTVNDTTTGLNRGIGARHNGSRQIIDNDAINKQVTLPDPDDINDGWNVTIENDGDNWQYITRNSSDTTSSIVRDDLNRSRETNALMRRRQVNQYTYLANGDRFALTVLDRGVIPHFHARKTDINKNLPLTPPITGVSIGLVSGDIERSGGGFTLNSSSFAVLRTNSRSSENRVFRITVHAQLSKLSNFSQAGDTIIEGVLIKNTDYLNDTRTESYWAVEDDALVTVDFTTLVELEDEDMIRPSFGSNPSVNNARFDYFDWTIVEVT